MKEDKQYQIDEQSLTMLNLVATQEATQEGISSENRSAAISLQLQKEQQERARLEEKQAKT